MSAVLALLARGGWIMPAIAVLSVLLYWRCFRLLLGLRRVRRGLPAQASMVDRHHWLEAARESFRQQRATISPMIAAAPLLGLLGTVTGMEKAFGSLSATAGGRSMENLAGGISEVLVATESGLMVALPAMLLLYLAHRELHGLALVANHAARGGDGA